MLSNLLRNSCQINFFKNFFLKRVALFRSETAKKYLKSVEDVLP